jgi:iron-sulfur cluster repair protein YtfE (RIC family)
MVDSQLTLPKREIGLMAELLWVHGMIRRDLETVQRLAAEVAKGGSAEQAISQIESLQTSGPLWKLRVHCLYYCRFIHGHHNLEDVALFPSIRRVDPSLNGVLDRLEVDHLQVSDLLDRIESSARGLGSEDTPEARLRLVGELNRLAEHLLEHLAFEEESLGPVLRGMEIDQIVQP